MPNTFFGLSIAKSGTYAAMAGINATAHNISNTETDGYSRQIVHQRASMPIRMNSTYGMAGTGTDVTGVEQMRSAYYDAKYRENYTIYGNYQTKADYMIEIENYFNEIKLEGFTTTFDSMFDSLQELAKNPADLTTRTEVTHYAQNFCEYFNSLSESLKSIQAKLNFEIKNQVDRINNLGQEIAGLTKQINIMEVNAGMANDLRDQRNLLLDELSQICDISIKENIVGDDVGITSFTVKIDGMTLVDTYNCNQLIVTPQKHLTNQTDVDSMFDISWSNGQSFDFRSSTLGGTLSALYEMRDGNNNEAFKGIVDAAEGDTTVTVRSTNVNDVSKLNIPQTGVIRVGVHEYHYTGFQVTEDEDGNYVYEFELAEDEEVLSYAEEETAMIGRDINYKGIPYYMAQINEFIRTFSREFNNIHTSGEDLNGNPGLDFFNAFDIVTGEEYVFGRSEEDIEDGIVLRSGTGSYVEEGDIKYGSYYFITAANFKVSSQVYSDPKLVAASSSIADGVENSDNAKALLALKGNASMFRQGAPASFLQTMVSEVGIDTKKAKQFAQNQEDICASIEYQRLSVMGVDTEEEAMNLIRYQNTYNLSAQAISVMNEIYNKLINDMGV